MSDLRKKVAELATENPTIAPDLRRMLQATTGLDTRIEQTISGFVTEVIAGVSQHLLGLNRDTRGLGVERAGNTWTGTWVTRWPGTFIEIQVQAGIVVEARQIKWMSVVAGDLKNGRSSRVETPQQISGAIWAAMLKRLQKGR